MNVSKFILILFFIPVILGADPWDDFILAVQNGDPYTVLSALQENPSWADRRDSQDLNPLYYAVKGGHSLLVEELLARGATPNTQGPQGESPLGIAASGGRFDIVELLVGAGGSVDTIDEDGISPLMNAIYHDDIEMFQLIMEQSPDLNFQDKDGVTPLMLAAYEGLADFLIILMQSGANPSLRDKNGETAEDYALVYNNTYAVEILKGDY